MQKQSSKELSKNATPTWFFKKKAKREEQNHDVVEKAPKLRKKPKSNHIMVNMYDDDDDVNNPFDFGFTALQIKLNVCSSPKSGTANIQTKGKFDFKSDSLPGELQDREVSKRSSGHQSYNITFAAPSSQSDLKKNKSAQKGSHNGITFSDHEVEVDSHYGGGILIGKRMRQPLLEEEHPSCSGNADPQMQGYEYQQSYSNEDSSLQEKDSEQNLSKG